MKKILLTRKGEEFSVLVDDEDYEELIQYTWNIRKVWHNYYAQRVTSRKLGPRAVIQMHRQIMDAPKEQKVDHIDGNGLNNQKANLRFVTHQENMRNSASRIGNSKYKGVRLRSDRPRPWRAVIVIDRKTKHLGYFSEEIEAARAYNKAAKLHFGEYARVNERI